MNAILTTPPRENSQLRRAIYAGSIFCLAANATSKKLRNMVVAVIQEILGSDYRHAQFRLDYDEYQLLIGKVQTVLYSVNEFSDAVRNLMKDVGFEPSENAFHPPRLRAVTDGGHNGAAPYVTYAAHRDTWYANPQSQVNWWIALHDTSQTETFTFFPTYFDKPIDNSSADFSFDDLSKRLASGQLHAGKDASHPTLAGAGPVRDQSLSFSCKSSEIILFSASHLHESCKNNSGATRFSVDFRTAHLEDDAQGMGAPNVDNESRGSALPNYIQPVGNPSPVL
jgi:hypothetical protein